MQDSPIALQWPLAYSLHRMVEQFLDLPGTTYENQLLYQFINVLRSYAYQLNYPVPVFFHV